MFLTLLTLALVGTAHPAPQCVPASAAVRQAASSLVGPNDYRPAVVLRRGDWPRSPRRRSRDYLDPDDDRDEEGGAGKVQPLAGLLPVVQKPSLSASVIAEQPKATFRRPHTPLIYALCTLLL